MSVRRKSCPTCGKNGNDKLYSSPNYVTGVGGNQWNMPLYYVICRNCGCIYLNPAPVEHDLNKFYTNAVISPPKKAADLDPETPKFKMFDRLMASHTSGTSSVFEIGAGTGELLMYIKMKYNPNIVRGIELSKPLVKHIKTEYKLNVKCGDFLSYKLRSKFDVIILDNVLEHFDSPLNVLIKVNNMLTDEGKAYIVVPNILRPQLGIRDQFSGHMTNFMPENLRLLMFKAGLWIEAYMRIDGSLLVRGRLLKKSDVLPNISFPNYISTIKRGITRILGRQEARINKVLARVRKLVNHSIFIYGAGEHTADLLSRVKFNKVMGLIDSNPMYRDKRMYGYVVFSPILLTAVSYDYILISSYASEISIKESLLTLGIPANKIVTMYQGVM